METNVEANLQSVALITAAMESAAEGKPVAVQELLKRRKNSLAAGVK